jgi:Kinesin motor domain
VYVEKLSEWVVRNESEILELMARGAQNRTTGATKLNDVSSRSHAVFIIIIEQSKSNGGAAPDMQRVSTSRHMGLAAGMPDMPVSVKVGLSSSIAATAAVGVVIDVYNSSMICILGATAPVTCCRSAS